MTNLYKEKEYALKETNPQLEWVESFAQDMFNKNHFKTAFLKVMKPIGGGQMIPIEFNPYKYQQAWTNDTSRKRYVNKSRQIGFSVNESLDSLHDALSSQQYMKLFMSLAQPQATKNLTVIANSINLMDEQYRIKLKRKSDKLLEFQNGSQIHALPAKPEAARSFSGDVFLDEFAFVAKDKETLRAVNSVAVREGYRISMGSTPYGQRGEFHRIGKEIGWDTSQMWLDDSVATRKRFYSEYKRVLAENETDWSFHVVAWWQCPDTTWEDILEATETESDRQQEFGLAFQDDTTSMFTLDLLTRRSNSTKPLFYEPDFSYDKFPRLKKPKGWRRVAGLDPAEKIDDTAFVIWDYSESKNEWYKRFQKTWNDVVISEYEEYVYKAFHAWDFDHLYVDYTGIGIGTVSSLTKLGLSEFQMTGLNFTNTLKHQLVYNAVSIYESEPQRVFTDMDKVYNSQFHNVRKEKTKGGRAKYSGKHDGNKDDIFWGAVMPFIENIDYEDSEVDVYVTDNSKYMRRNRY